MDFKTFGCLVGGIGGVNRLRNQNPSKDANFHRLKIKRIEESEFILNTE